MIQAEYGFIGCGNMGGAIARVLCKTVDPKRVLLSNRTPAKAEALAKELGCQAGDNLQAAQCAYIFLGVKPHLMADMLRPLQPVLAERQDGFVLVSMAAGLSMDRLQEMAGGPYPIFRILPNLAAQVGESMIPWCAKGVAPEKTQALLTALAPAGRLDQVEEPLLEAGSCVSGCGMAYAYVFLEALADGGVACGLPRQKAQLYAAQCLLGAGRMALEGDVHTAERKDAVCSPGGTTIEGIQALEEGGFRAAAMKAVRVAYEKSHKLGK